MKSDATAFCAAWSVYDPKTGIPEKESPSSPSSAGAGDDLIQIGAQSGQVRKFGAARSVIDKIDGARPFFLEHGEVFPVIFRKIVGIGQRHDVQRVGKAAQAVLFACGDGCAVGETGENERMFALLVFPQRSYVLRP